MNENFMSGFEKTASVGAGLLALGGAAGLGALLGHASSLDANDIENNVDVYFKPQEEQLARELLAKEKEKSFIARNSALTGALTLGLAPAIQNSAIGDRVTSSVVRSSPDLQGRMAKVKAMRHQRRVERMPEIIADREARARERMMGQGAFAAMNIANSFANRD